MTGTASPILLGFASTVLFASASFVRGDEPTVFEVLPEGTLVAARVAELAEVDTTVRPLAEKFGLGFPALGQLAAQLEGVDPEGDAVVGLAQGAEGEYLPFVLLPVSDYKAFVRAGDGDPGIEVTPVTLAGEELLASHRGRWALVTNVIEQFDNLGELDSSTARLLAGKLGDELLTIAVTDAGLNELQAMAGAGEESPRQLANRRRILASRPMNWRSLADWRQRLTLHSEMVDQLVTECAAVVLAADADASARVALRLELLPRSPSDIKPPVGSVPAVDLSDQRMVVTADCAWGSPWVDWLLQLHISSFASGSDDVGVDYFRADDFQAFGESVAAASGLVHNARLLMIAPADQQPTMSNSAVVVAVDDAQAFAAAFEEVIVDWNRMVERSRRNVDFLYEIKPLEVGDRTGKRYAVDLPSAFRQESVPEVREVMDKLYGRNGVWAMDVLPVGDSQVLISDLPDALRDQLLQQLPADQAPATDPQAGWRVRLNPAVLQDWLNEVKRDNYGDGVIGWTPRPLRSTSQVDIQVTTHEPVLRVETEIPADVVTALAALVRGE